jgi:glycosyltransferase involved in cell wall biosynthesis
MSVASKNPRGRLKVLHVITTVSRGGAENQLMSLIERQVWAGFRVAVAYLKGNGYWRDALGAMGVDVIDLKLRRYGNPAPVVRLQRMIWTIRPSLVHAHMPPAELYCRAALMGTPSRTVPLVVTKHNDEPFYKGFGQRTVGRWVAKRADRIIAISDAVKDYFFQQGYAADREKIVTVRYGIDPGPFENLDTKTARSVRQSWSVADGEFLIGTAARFEPQKALHVLVEAFSRYLHDARVPAKLVLVGRGSLEAELRRLARRLGVERNIIWAGFREDIPAVMNALDLFVLPSLYEGFGLVLIEAMAAGKPIVASCVSAIPEIVENRHTGILIPPENPEELAMSLKFFEDPGARASFGVAGRERVREKFAMDRMVEGVTAVYRAVLGEL